MAEKVWRVLTINPGSTSTKVGLFEGDQAVFTRNVEHDPKRLDEFDSMADQLGYRRDCIMDMLDEHGVGLDDIDAFVGRGGGLLSLVGGTYNTGETLIDHARNNANGVIHPANLGSLLAFEFGQECGKPSFVVNPPDTDEFSDVARMTGLKGVYRMSHLHALNLKETAIRHAASQGTRYEDARYIGCHLGGGLSICAHDHGRMVDGNDIVGGSGPMSPTRCGNVPVIGVLDAIDAGATTKELRRACMKTGGFVGLLGTSDAREVEERAAAGDEAAAVVWEAMLYQVTKDIGAMAAALKGRVDGILLGGGMVHSKSLVSYIEEACGWIAPVFAYPGEFELEAMAAGAIRVLDGVEEPLEYTGEPAWGGFAWDAD